jgi:hypothetical protein
MDVDETWYGRVYTKSFVVDLIFAHSRPVWCLLCEAKIAPHFSEGKKKPLMQEYSYITEKCRACYFL